MNYRETYKHITLIAWSTIALFGITWLIVPNKAEANLLFKPKIDCGVGDGPLFVAVGPLNGDTILDLTAANQGSDNVSIFINTGDEAKIEDIPPGFRAEEAIYNIFNAGGTKGFSNDPLRCCPEIEITRAQMGAFLGRATHDSNFTPPPPTGIFADVPLW